VYDADVQGLARVIRVIGALIGAVAVTVSVGVPLAYAHGETGDIEVGDPTVVGPLEIEFPIRITYQNDGHPAEEAEGLTVSGKGPDGASFGPDAAFTAGAAPGVWVARVVFPVPGPWELVVEVDEPAASVTLSVDVADPNATPEATEPEPPADEVPPDADGADGAGDLDGAVPEADGAIDTATAPLVRVDSDDGGAPVLLVVVGFVIAVVLGALAYRIFSARSATTD
jgi:hypothetical protein